MNIPEFNAVWSLFVALETKSVDEATELAEPLLAEFSTDEVLAGWALVAAVLRAELVRHARKLDCPCGSDEWLRRLVLENAAK